jgi:hypothetical protein
MKAIQVSSFGAPEALSIPEPAARSRGAGALAGAEP